MSDDVGGPTVSLAEAGAQSRLSVATIRRRLKAAGKRAGQAPILSDELRHRIATTRTGGASFARIADELNAEGIPTAKGGRWHASTVRHVCMSVERDAELEGIAA